MAKSKENFKEEDLYKPIHDYLVQQGYKVRSEVKDCDITAVKDEELIVVELKKNLSVELLVQAVKRQKVADSVYIAIPKPKKLTYTKKWNEICHLIRRLELGFILVSLKKDNSFIEIVLHPQPFDRLRSIKQSKNKRVNIIKEIEGRYKDGNIGGSTGKKLLTAYRESAVFIACCLDRFGSLKPKKLRELGTDARKTLSILYENHYGWFQRIENGLYGLTPKGKEELKLYPDLTQYYYEKINSTSEETKNL